jgi:hypothetical protein
VICTEYGPIEGLWDTVAKHSTLSIPPISEE